MKRHNRKVLFNLQKDSFQDSFKYQELLHISTYFRNKKVNEIFQRIWLIIYRRFKKTFYLRQNQTTVVDLGQLWLVSPCIFYRGLFGSKIPLHPQIQPTTDPCSAVVFSTEKHLHISGPTQFKLCCLKVNCISNIRNENSIPHEYIRQIHFSIYKPGCTKPNLSIPSQSYEKDWCWYFVVF